MSVALFEVALTVHARDRLFERTALLPSQAVREVRTALRQGHVVDQFRGFALATGQGLRRYGISIDRRRRRVVVMTVYDEERVAAESRETARWRMIAGSWDACRDCGGGLLVRDRPCPSCRPSAA